MNPERWRRISEVFHAARGRDAEAREAIVNAAFGADEELRAEVDAMLAADRDAGEFGERAFVSASDESDIAPGPSDGPALVPGARLGPYQVIGLLGLGGMGEVYRARDERLGREVAVKVLPVKSSADPHRLRRFENEARAAGALSHPNLLSVFDTGLHQGAPYLVFELLEGSTLREALGPEPPSLQKALDLALQTAQGLAAAHDRGIVHRDLKPENLFVTKEGRLKILDFGLAKLVPSLGPGNLRSEGPAASAITEGGMVLGTVGYMSPEQVRGEPADHRSDIFSFGSVLYEMLAGQRAFQEATLAETMTAILKKDPPPLASVRGDVPAGLERVVSRCLSKTVEERFQSARDLAFALEMFAGVPASADRADAGVRSGSPGRRSYLPWFTAAGLGILAAVFALTRLTGSMAPVPLLRSALPPPAGARLEASAGFALSPDGRQLAFIARDDEGKLRLWVQSLAALQALPLAGTEGANDPFWSPDGRDVGFFADQRLKRVPAAGGVVQSLAGEAIEPKGGTWSPEGRIVYVPDYRTGLFEVSANGGEPRELTKLKVDDGEQSHRWPKFLPDGKTLLFLVQTAEGGAEDDRSRIEVLSAKGERHEILRANSSAAYAPPGQLLFWRHGTLYAQELDSNLFRLRGEARLVAEDVEFDLSEWAAFSVSNDGTLAYLSSQPWRLEWRERTGRLLSVAGAEGDYRDAQLSPDGRRVAYVANFTTVRVRDLVRATDTRLSLGERDAYSPVWSPSGDWVAYASNKPKEAGGEIVRCRPTGLSEKEVLYSSANVVRNLSWSPNGRWIAFEESDDIFLLDVDSRAAQTRIRTPSYEGSPKFSPDGRWLAFVSDESERLEVYVVPALDEPGGKWQISNRGGFRPRWGRQGDELFFLGLDYEVMVARVGFVGDPEFGVPEPLFVLSGGKPGTDFDIGPDGRILVTAQPPTTGAESFRLIQNWPRLLLEPRR